MRREGERRHFWAGAVVFASQFEESGFDVLISTDFVRNCYLLQK